MKTLLLNPSTWDLMISADLNIAVAGEPYALAQDAASAIKLFQGEDYFDVTRGVPYWQQILGRWPTIRVMKANWIAAAKTVPGVTAATCFIESVVDRRPKGQVQITDQTGSTATVGL